MDILKLGLVKGAFRTFVRLVFFFVFVFERDLGHLLIVCFRKFLILLL